MSGLEQESGAPGQAASDGPDEFDLSMDEFASGKTPPADRAAGDKATDPDDGHKEQGDTPPGSAEAGASTTAAGAAPLAGDQSDDIWANAPEPLRNAYAAIQRDYEYKLSAAKGRLSAADRELDRLRREQQTRQTEPTGSEGQGGQAANADDPFNPQKLAQLREEYGEVAGPLVDMIDALKGKVDQIAQPVQQLQQSQSEAAAIAQVQTLQTRHPDWQQTVSDDRFRGWYEQQPQFIRTAIERNANGIVDGQEAAHVLDLYKQAIGAGSPPPSQQQDTGQSRLSDKRQRQLDAARDAASGGGQAATAGIPDDFDAAMDAYAARADARGRRG